MCAGGFYTAAILEGSALTTDPLKAFDARVSRRDLDGMKGVGTQCPPLTVLTHCVPSMASAMLVPNFRLGKQLGVASCAIRCAEAEMPRGWSAVQRNDRHRPARSNRPDCCQLTNC